MERDDLASLAGFFADGVRLAPGETLSLGEEAAHHMRVRRLDVGSRVYLADGAGNQATGTLTRLSRRDADVSVVHVAHTPRTYDVHLLVPISDRDRMLWLAEKAAELGVASWRPVMWTRSRSVSPRGEGQAFGARVGGRMRAALLQSHSPWMPSLHADASPAAAVGALPASGSRLLLDTGGEPILRRPVVAPVTVAVGPEGGLESSEQRMLADCGFHPVSLGANVLRFETAAVAAVAVVRSVLAVSAESTEQPLET